MRGKKAGIGRDGLELERRDGGDLMQDMRKTKKQLVEELEELRKKVARLEAEDRDCQRPDMQVLTALANQMHEPTVILDWEGNLLAGNSLAAEVIEVDSKEDLVGINLATIMHPDSLEQAGGDLQAVKESEAEFSASYKLLVHGRTVHIESHGTKIELSDGSVDLVSFRDVTCLREQEGRERANELILKNVLDHSSTVVFIKDTDGKYLLINKRYEKLFGITNEEIIGKTDFDVFPADAAEQFRAKDLKAIEAGGPIEEEEHVPQEDGLHTYISVKFPMYDTEGKPFATCGISTDITERKCAEQILASHHEELELRVKERTHELTELNRRLTAEIADRKQAYAERKQALAAIEESERKFRSLAESTSAHISIIQDDRHVYANQAFLDYYELDLEDLKLITPEDLMMGMLGSEAIKQAAPIWQAALERGDKHMRFEYQDMEGTWFQTNVTVMELDGKEAYLAMDFDITELKQAQNEMYRADKMAALGQIIAGVAHEINNPNNFIYFNLPILRKYIEAITPLLELRLADEPDLKILNMPYQVFLDDVFKLLENMEHGSTRITSIVSDLKTYVRIDEDQDRKDEPVGPAIDQVMTLVGKQVRKMVKRFDVEIEDGLPLIKMNAGKIEQVLINLLINAGHAADKEASWVKVSARPAAGDEGWVEILVEDNGMGIPEDKLEKIFEPFFTSKGRDQGTGLGLSISQRIIEEHGGKIRVESKVGQGTCFTVLLPAAEEA